MVRNIKKEVTTFIKAQGSAIFATGCDYLMRLMLDKVIDINYVWATFLGAVFGGFVNCCINYRFVFGSGDRRKRDVAWRYLLIWCGSVLLNTAGTAFFKEVIHIRAYFAMLLTSALVAIGWNYTMQRCFVFKKKKKA